MTSEKQELEILEAGREVTALAAGCCTGGTNSTKIK